MKTLRYSLQLVLGIGLTLLIQLWDRRRLTEEQRARSWNTATWAVALYWFGPLSMLGWCWVTRIQWKWKPLGLLYLVAILVVLTGIDQLVAMALGLEP